MSEDEKKLLNRSPYTMDGDGANMLETIEGAGNYNRWLSEKIEDYLGEKNIEFGAGTGTIASILSEKHRLELFEVSSFNLSVLKRRFEKNANITALGANLFSNKKFSSYDCIYSSNVLEHIEDDIAIIDHSLSLLKKGGYFVSLVPAMPSLYSRVDLKLGHYRRYGWEDYRRLKKMEIISSGKARIVRYSFFNPIGAVGWFLKMKLLRAENIKPQDAMLMNSIIPFVSVIDYLPLPFGQSIQIVIQKLV